MAQIKIVQLERVSSTGAVVKAHWMAKQVDGKYYGEAQGVVDLDPKDQSDPSFINFNDLTEAQVVSWVMGKINVSAVDADLQEQIDKQKAIIVATGLPWGEAAYKELKEGV
jgi:hypothetical protein